LRRFTYTIYAAVRFTLAGACGSAVLPIFVVRFRARSAKTNNDRKKTYCVPQAMIASDT